MFCLFISRKYIKDARATGPTRGGFKSKSYLILYGSEDHNISRLRRSIKLRNEVVICLICVGLHLHSQQKLVGISGKDLFFWLHLISGQHSRNYCKSLYPWKKNLLETLLGNCSRRSATAHCSHSRHRLHHISDQLHLLLYDWHFIKTKHFIIQYCNLFISQFHKFQAGMWKRLFSNRFRFHLHRFRFRFHHFYQNLS